MPGYQRAIKTRSKFVYSKAKNIEKLFLILTPCREIKSVPCARGEVQIGIGRGVIPVFIYLLGRYIPKYTIVLIECPRYYMKLRPVVRL